MQIHVEKETQVIGIEMITIEMQHSLSEEPSHCNRSNLRHSREYPVSSIQLIVSYKQQNSQDYVLKWMIISQ